MNAPASKKQKVDPNVNPKEKNENLWTASENGNLELVRELLNEEINVNLQDDDGMTALMSVWKVTMFWPP